MVETRAVVQRVSRCEVTVADRVLSRTGIGLLVLLGVAQGDGDKELEYVADKTLNLRVFPDDEGKMNLSVLDVAGELTVVSQFTLLADTRKGRRPSFVSAADPAAAEPIYERFVERLRASGMLVSLDNWGPVTIVIDSP